MTAFTPQERIRLRQVRADADEARELIESMESQLAGAQLTDAARAWIRSGDVKAAPADYEPPAYGQSGVPSHGDVVDAVERVGAARAYIAEWDALTVEQQAEATAPRRRG